MEKLEEIEVKKRIGVKAAVATSALLVQLFSGSSCDEISIGLSTEMQAILTLNFRRGICGLSMYTSWTSQHTTNTILIPRGSQLRKYFSHIGNLNR